MVFRFTNRAIFNIFKNELNFFFNFTTGDPKLLNSIVREIYDLKFKKKIGIPWSRAIKCLDDNVPHHDEHDEVDPVPEGMGVLHKVHHVRPPLQRYHLYKVILIFFERLEWDRVLAEVSTLSGRNVYKNLYVNACYTM